MRKIRQSYWKTSNKTPVWKQQNDDDRIGEDEEITGSRKQTMIDKNPYLREGRVIETKEGLKIKGTKVFD